MNMREWWATGLIPLLVGCGLLGRGDGAFDADVTCADCTIVLDTLGRLEDLTFSGPATGIARDTSGIVYVVGHDDLIVKAYGGDGRFLRQIGRRGGGPGEYEVVRNLLIGQDGTLHVLDAALGRHSTFSPSGVFVSGRQVPVNGGIGMPAGLFPDGRLLVNLRRSGLNDSTPILMVMDTAGGATGLTEHAPAPDPRFPWLQQRQLWVRRDGGIFVARPYDFTVEIFSPDLRRVDSIQRRADWLPANDPALSPADGVFDRPFSARIMSVWEDPEGRLWLLFAVPVDSWVPGPPLREGVPLDTAAFMARARLPRLETILEVIDPERREVLARARFPGSLGLPFGQGYFSRTAPDSAGQPAVHIMQARLLHSNARS